MNKPSPQERVCAISELVEAILVYAQLSPLHLLRARRINRTFNLVILNALPLRRVLFLDAVDMLGPKEPDSIGINPFLSTIFPKRARSFFYRRHHQMLYSHVEEREALILKASVCKKCYSNRLNLASLPDEGCYLHLPLLETYDEEDYFSPAQWYKHALWRNMYATRPVVPLHVVDTCVIAHRWEIVPKTTLGEIVDNLIVGKVVFWSPEERAKLE